MLNMMYIHRFSAGALALALLSLSSPAAPGVFADDSKPKASIFGPNGVERDTERR